jgi:amyloid beta precursor protein binding protein 1
VHAEYKLTTLSFSVRAPTAELPNVAAFVGGLVAQETIKLITKQYVPINGYLVADLVSTYTVVVS